MKLFLLPIILLFSSPILSKEKAPVETRHVSILSVKKEIFYFKVDRYFLGARLDVFKDGAVVLSEKVLKRKMIVDFFHFQPGTYIIQVSKGETIETFECTVNLR